MKEGKFLSSRLVVATQTNETQEKHCAPVALVLSSTISH